jgi:hypothetical protein
MIALPDGRKDGLMYKLIDEEGELSNALNPALIYEFPTDR